MIDDVYNGILNIYPIQKTPNSQKQNFHFKKSVLQEQAFGNHHVLQEQHHKININCHHKIYIKFIWSIY